MNDLINRASFRETLRLKSAELDAMMKGCNQRELQYITKQTGIRMSSVVLDQVMTELDSAPAIDPARHAHWILHLEIGIGKADKGCSGCGAMSLIWSHYCHACGAKMDEEETNDA